MNDLSLLRSHFLSIYETVFQISSVLYLFREFEVFDKAEKPEGF